MEGGKPQLSGRAREEKSDGEERRGMAVRLYIRSPPLISLQSINLARDPVAGWTPYLTTPPTGMNFNHERAGCSSSLLAYNVREQFESRASLYISIGDQKSLVQNVSSTLHAKIARKCVSGIGIGQIGTDPGQIGTDVF